MSYCDRTFLLECSLQSELEDVYDRIKKWFVSPNKASLSSSAKSGSKTGAVTLDSLKARRDEIENQLTKLHSESEPNNLISDEIPPSSGNDVSDNDLLEALRMHEEREAAINSGAVRPQHSTSLASNGISGYSHSTHGGFSPLPQQQYPGAFSADQSVTMNGATYHKSLPPTISSRDSSNYAYDNYSNSAQNCQASNNYNSSMHTSRQSPQVDYNLSVSNPYSASTYLPPVLSSNGNANVFCHCGFPCLLLTSRTGDSMGQTFYACPKGRSDEGNCRFFQWEKPTEKNFTTTSGPIFDNTRC